MTYTEETQAWLDNGAAAAVAARLRAGYEPLYAADDRIGRMPVGHVLDLARTYAIVTALATEHFASCLDVGSGGGRLCHLIERLFGAACAGVDLSREFAEAARRDFGVPAYVANAAALPFADAQFDVVLCSEVIEHVEHPFAVLAELWRVARRTVLVTTQECCGSAWQRRLHMAAVERAQPHGERNYFIPDDFRRAFGDGVQLRALLHLPERIRLLRRDSIGDLADCVRALTADRRIGPGSFGVLVVARKVGAAVPPRAEPSALLFAVLDTDRRLDALAARRAADPLAPAPPSAPVPALGTPAPVCPECGGHLTEADAEPERPARKVCAPREDSPASFLSLRERIEVRGSNDLITSPSASPERRGIFGLRAPARAERVPPRIVAPGAGEARTEEEASTSSAGAGEGSALRGVPPCQGVVDFLEAAGSPLWKRRARGDLSDGSCGQIPLNPPSSKGEDSMPARQGSLSTALQAGTTGECAEPAAVAAITCSACGGVYPAPQGVPRLLASAEAVARRQQGWLERTDLAPLRRALAQRPLPWARARSALRWALKAGNFLRLPLPWRDKLRLARLVWRGN